MALLHKELLQDLGIELSEQDYALLAEHFDTTLQVRVIDEIVEELTSDQAEQLAALQGASDEQLLTWLTASVPNFKEIVSDEVDILLGELAEDSESFSSR
jgi:hypothetical protein